MTLLMLAVSVVIAFVAAAFGRTLLKLVRMPEVSSSERCLLGLAVGFGVLGYAVLAAGVAGFMCLGTILVILVVMLLVSLREAKALLLEAVSAVRTNSSEKLSLSQALIVFSIVGLVAMALIRALAPPSGMDWDGLAYHLAVPKMYLSEGRIFYVPFISHSNFPFLTEMLYVVGLAFDSAVLAKLFHFWMYLALGTAVYAVCRRHFNPRAGGLAELVIMSVPVVFWEAGVAYADLSMALYVTLAIYAVLNWNSDGATAWLIVAGVMGGFALGTKVITAVPVGLLVLWIVLAGDSGVEWRKRVSLGLLFGALALIVGAPWYIKSFVYTGNPVYPFMYSVFGGRNWSDTAAEAYRESQLAFGVGRSLKDLFFVPWSLTMDGFRFYDYRTFSGLVGPAFLGLLPVYVFTAKPNSSARLLAVVGLAVLIAWFFMMQQARYLIVAMPLFAVICGAGVRAANDSWRAGGYVVNGFLALCVALTLFVGLMMAVQPAKVVFGMLPAEDYLSETIASYDVQSFVNRYTPENAGVVLFDEVLGFYLDRDYIWGNPGHHEMIPWGNFDTGKDMVNFFLRQGYTHALINWVNWGAAGDDMMHAKLIPDAIGRGLMIEAYSSKGASLYEFSGE